MKIDNKGERGNAVVEFALVFQLVLIMLLSSFNIGVYAYGLIAVQNAARTAALRNSGGAGTAADQAGACAMAIRELRGLPNIGPAFSGNCSSEPLVVSSAACDGASACPSGSTSADGEPAPTCASPTPSLIYSSFRPLRPKQLPEHPRCGSGA